MIVAKSDTMDEVECRANTTFLRGLEVYSQFGLRPGGRENPGGGVHPSAGEGCGDHCSPERRTGLIIVVLEISGYTLEKQGGNV